MLPQPDIPNVDLSNEELDNRSEKLDAVFECYDFSHPVTKHR